MEWQQIKAFASLARLGSFRRAAAETLRTQSAVSQQIKALEAELDCDLLLRQGRRSLALTSAGERFLAFCQRVLNEEESLRQALGELRAQPRGRLTIAAPFTTIYHLLPDILQGFLAEFPGVELTLLDRGQAEAIRLVKEGQAQLGVALASRLPREMLAFGWERVRPVLMVPSGHPLALAERVTLRQVAAYPLILPAHEPGGGARGQLEERLKQLGLSYRVAMESANVELSALYVEKGVGLAFATVVRDLPWLAGRSLVMLPLDRLFRADHLAAFVRRDAARPRWLERLLEAIQSSTAEGRP